MRRRPRGQRRRPDAARPYVTIETMNVQHSRALRFCAVALRSGLLLGIMSAGVAAQRPAPAQSKTDLFDEIYQRGRGIDSTLKTLTARFTETTTSSLLTRPVVARGTLAVIRPDRVVLRYTDPDQRVVLIDGNRLTLTWPSRQLNQVIDITTAQRRV